MTFKARTHRRWIRRLALGLALAAIVAPSAQAVDLADLDHAYGPANFVTTPQVILPPGWAGAQFGPANFVTAPQLTIPEGWGNAQFGPANFVTGDALPTTLPATPTTPVPAPGFHWADAGVGIAIGAGLALILVAGLMLGRRRGRFASA